MTNHQPIDRDNRDTGNKGTDQPGKAKGKGYGKGPNPGGWRPNGNGRGAGGKGTQKGSGKPGGW